MAVSPRPVEAAPAKAEPRPPRVRRWASGAAALVLGVLVTAAGAGIGVMHLIEEGATTVAVAGVVTLVVGLGLLAAGGVTLWRSARGWWRLLAIPVALLVLALLVPLTFAVYATHAPPIPLGDATPQERGLAAVDAETVTRDGAVLSAWYVPSENGAAVVLLHGSGSTRTSVLDHAVVLARHGYGVLLLDTRGHGGSGGNAMEFGWFGDADIAAGLNYLQGRPEVDPTRLGVVGMSMGGEQAIGAIGSDPRIRAVVAEGVTGRTLADHGWLPTSWNGWVQRGIDAVMYGTADLLTTASPPTDLRSAVADAPRPVLIVAGTDSEIDAAAYYRDAAPETVQVWEIPGTPHTAGLARHPEEWEARVTQFLDAALAAPAGAR